RMIYPLSLHDALPIYRVAGPGCAFDPGNCVLAGLCHRAFRARDALCLRRTQTVGAVPLDSGAGRAAGLRAVSLLAIGAAANRLSDRKSTRLNSSHVAI